jgi:hypothetical protein
MLKLDHLSRYKLAAVAAAIKVSGTVIKVPKTPE